jgi:hypothetical protein
MHENVRIMKRTVCLFVCLFVVCPCRSNAEHRGLLSEVSMVMCVDVVSDQPTDGTSSTKS